MDTEDADNDSLLGFQETKPEKIIAPPAEDDAHNGNFGFSFFSILVIMAVAT